MIFARSASASTSALVQACARDGSTRQAAQLSFIRAKLAFSAVALAGAPFFLAFIGLPTPLEAAIFACSLVPIAAAMLVARSGRLGIAQGMTACAFGAIACALAFGPHAGFIACYPWLALACLEILSTLHERASAAAALLVLPLVAVVAAHAALRPDETGAAIMAGIAVMAMVPSGRHLLDLFEAVRTQAAEDAGRHNALAHALGDLIVDFDADGLVRHASARSQDLLGVAPADLAGRGLFEHVLVADRPAFLKLVSDAAHSGDTHVAVLRVRNGHSTSRGSENAQPQHLWVEMRAHRLAAPGERAAGTVAVLRDVTARRLESAEVEDARQSVGSALRSKTEFLANMSHELRTPLNAIIGFSEMLGSHTLCPADVGKQREYARIVHQSGQHLLSVVNAILDMSKLQSGTFVLVPEPFPVAPLLDQCCDMMLLKAEEGGVEIRRDVPERLADIVGDRRACKQILLNLLSNAIKFTPEGGRVSVRIRPEGTSLRLTVADTGIGIAENDLSRLGAPFFQARSSFCRPYEGTGLGLSVIRGLVGLHSGSLTVESELGRGTTVDVVLPLDCRVAAPAADASARKERVNVVDHPRNSSPIGEAVLDAKPRIRKIA